MSYSDFDKQHWRNTLAYMRAASSMFDKAVDRIARLYGELPLDVPFDINNYPGLKKGIDLELKRLASELQQGIINGINNEWTLSNVKNDEVVNTLLRPRDKKSLDALKAFARRKTGVATKEAVDAILSGKTLPTKLQDKWMNRNLNALSAFKKRTDAGLGLSDRVWNIVKGQAVDFERQMALGIYEGKGAAQMATDMKQYLRHPDKLFRRVRDEAGNLQLSRAARDFHPGQGVYRSSYKNALRMTRTETNKSYQKADNERWNQQDFVLGIEVQRSNVDYECDICDAGVGEYPKDYQWDLWHPNCRCRAAPILASQEDFLKSIDAAFDDREYNFSGQVTEFPDKMEDFQKKTGYEHFGH